MSEEVVFNTISQPKAFLGASTSYKVGLKGLLYGDQDTLAQREIEHLVKRSEHAVRNDGHAKAALTKYITSLGAIKVIWTGEDGKTNLPMQEAWEEFAKNPSIDGYGNFANVQSVWNASKFITGTAFTRMIISRTGNTNKIPLKLQSIPTSQHDIFYQGKKPSDNIKNGIKFASGKRKSYFFKKDGGFIQNLAHIEVKADDLIHIFQRTSSGQWIGIPELAPVLLSLYELDELTEATVAKQKAAQAIAWIVENTNPMSMTPTGSPTYQKDKSENDKLVFKASGGNTQYLNKGERINFYQSTDIGANLPILIQSELRKIASSLGIPFHSLTGNVDGLNFSSLRAIAVEFRQRLEYIHYFYTIPLGIEKITNRFKELAGLYISDIGRVSATFQLPRWRGVDDLKDAQADVLEMQAGIGDLQEKLAERHLTFEQVLQSNKLMGELEAARGKPLAGSTSADQNTNNQSNTNSSSN